MLIGQPNQSPASNGVIYHGSYNPAPSTKQPLDTLALAHQPHAKQPTATLIEEKKTANNTNVAVAAPQIKNLPALADSKPPVVFVQQVNKSAFEAAKQA